MFTAHLWKHRVAKLEFNTNDVMTVRLQYPIKFGFAAIFYEKHIFLGDLLL